jgi:hypothetical protein
VCFLFGTPKLGSMPRTAAGKPSAPRRPCFDLQDSLNMPKPPFYDKPAVFRAP